MFGKYAFQEQQCTTALQRCQSRNDITTNNLLGTEEKYLNFNVAHYTRQAHAS
jgi:hypothetical protein